MHVRWKEGVAQCRQPYVMEMFTHPDPEDTISRSQLQGKVSGQRNGHLLCLHSGMCHDHWWTVLVTDRRETKQIKKKNAEQSTQTDI